MLGVTSFGTEKVCCVLSRFIESSLIDLTNFYLFDERDEVSVNFKGEGMVARLTSCDWWMGTTCVCCLSIVTELRLSGPFIASFKIPWGTSTIFMFVS